MTALITDINKIRSVSNTKYKKYKTALPFPKALQIAFQTETRPSDCFAYPEYSGFLSYEEFWNYIGNIPVIEPSSPFSPPTNPISKQYKMYGNFYLTEHAIFSNGMDINIYTHLPFINDGFHTHDHFELNYVYHGKADFCFEDEHLILDEGTLLIIAPDSPHNVRAFENDLIISIMIRKTTFNKIFWSLLNNDTLLSAFFRNSLKQNNERNYLIFQTDNEVIIQSYIQKLMAEFGIKDSLCNNNMICILSLFFATVLRKYSNTTRFYNIQELLDKHSNLNILFQYMRQNYNTITLKDVAEKFHYSESFFSRLIQKNFGKPFSVLIRELRLSHAQELLRYSNYTLEEICGIIGYNSVSAFSRAYKAYYGIAPGNARNEDTSSPF